MLGVTTPAQVNVNLSPIAGAGLSAGVLVSPVQEIFDKGDGVGEGERVGLGLGDDDWIVQVRKLS